MERLSKITPGAVFLILLIVILLSSPEIWSMMYEKIHYILNLLDGQEATVLISLNFILLIFIVSLIAALSFTIEMLWDFIFYSFIFKGYNQKEYELLKDYLLKSIGDNSYLFSWDKIPGNDSGRLIEFLYRHFAIEWVKTAEIEKIDDGRAIKVSTGTNFLLLSLNDENTKVYLKIDEGRTYEFIAKTENSKLNIYDNSIFINEIESMKVQPIYGQFLHSYARQTFVNWLARRWDTFHESATNSIGIFLAIVSGCGFIYFGKYTYGDTTKFILLIAIFLILIILSVGKKRKKELLMSEKLFCISIVDPDVRLAFREISEAITERGQNENDIASTLDKRL